MCVIIPGIDTFAPSPGNGSDLLSLRRFLYPGTYRTRSEFTTIDVKYVRVLKLGSLSPIGGSQTDGVTFVREGHNWQAHQSGVQPRGISIAGQHVIFHPRLKPLNPEDGILSKWSIILKRTTVEIHPPFVQRFLVCLHFSISISLVLLILFVIFGESDKKVHGQHVVFHPHVQLKPFESGG